MRRMNHLFILLVVCFLQLNIYALSSNSSEWELRISVEKADIRMEPDMKSPIVTFISKGSILKSYEKVGEWFRMITADEKGFVVIGYIHSSAVEIISEKIEEEPDYWEEEPDFFQGIGLSVKLTGGLNYFSGGDIDKGTRGLCDLNADYISSIGYTVRRKEIKHFHRGYDITADIIFNLKPQVGIGLGVGYIHANERNFIIFSGGLGDIHRLDMVPTISAVPIRLGLFFTLPIHRLVNVSFNGGTALYLTKYCYVMSTPLGNMESLYYKASAKGLGFHGGIGFEVNLSPRAAFVIEGQGRYAKITNFKGTAKSSKYILYDYIGSEEKGVLYYLEGQKYPSLAILEEEPYGYKTVRKATFDFSGFIFRAGIKIKF